MAPRRSFPRATQPQLIRANQRDLLGVAQLRGQAEDVLRATFGARWLMRWEKELDVAARLAYYGLTIGCASQTLGEEYVDIWQRVVRSRRPPSPAVRWSLVALYALPHYLAARLAARAQRASSDAWPLVVLRRLPTALDVAAELNLAVFYFSGVYYTLAKRLLGVSHITSMPQDLNNRPPSYALLGILLTVRLAYRLVSALRAVVPARHATGKQRERDDEMYIDGRRVSDLLDADATADEAERNAEDDPYTVLDLRAVPDSIRASRRCALCLEERTASCATECGHLFCWSCIVGWGREKAECPLCRQSLNLRRLLPIANL